MYNEHIYIIQYLFLYFFYTGWGAESWTPVFRPAAAAIMGP